MADQTENKTGSKRGRAPAVLLEQKGKLYKCASQDWTRFLRMRARGVEGVDISDFARPLADATPLNIDELTKERAENLLKGGKDAAVDAAQTAE